MPAARRCRAACGRIAVEMRHRLAHRRAGLDAVGGPLHLGGDAGQLLLPPLVGLVEVDARAEEGAASAARTARADGVALARLRQQLVAQERVRAVRTRRRPRWRRAVEIGTQRRRAARAPSAGVASRANVAKKPSGRRCRAHCSIAGAHLPAGADVAARGGEPQRLDVAVDRAPAPRRGARATVAQSSTVAVGVRSNVSRIVCSGEAMFFRSDSSAPVARSSSRDLELLAQRGDGDPVVGVGRLGRRERGERARAAGRTAAWYQSGVSSGQPVVVAGDAEVRSPSSGRGRPTRRGSASATLSTSVGMRVAVMP